MYTIAEDIPAICDEEACFLYAPASMFCEHLRYPLGPSARATACTTWPYILTFHLSLKYGTNSCNEFIFQRIWASLPDAFRALSRKF